MGHQLGTLKSSRASGGGWRGGKSEPMNTVAEGSVMRKLSLKEEGFDHITTPTLPQSSHVTFPWWELLHSPLFQSLLILILNCCCCSIAKLSHGLQHSRLPCPSLSCGVCSNHAHWVSDAIQPSYPLSSPSPPTFNLAWHQCFFQWVRCSSQVAKVLELQLQLSTSNDYSGLVSFKTDWFDLHAVQGILKSLLQHHQFFGA